MSIPFTNLVPTTTVFNGQPAFSPVDIQVPVDVDVAGFTTLTVEISDKRDFTTAVEVLNSTGGFVSRVDAKTVELDTPLFGGAFALYGDKFYKVKRNGVVVGRGQLLNIATAAKAARRRR